MNERTIFSIPDDYDDIWLIGITIDPDKEQSDIFTIIFAGDVDIPLTTDGYIVFCTKLDCLTQAISIQKPEITKKINALKLHNFDIAKMLYLLESENIDKCNIIIDSLNIILDLVKASGLRIPVEYKNKLYRVAEFFTFNQKIAELFSEDDIDRDEVTNAILWCLGAIISKSKFL